MPSLNLCLAPFLKSPTHRNSEPLSSKQHKLERFSVPQLHKTISTLDLTDETTPHKKLINSSLLLKACIRSRNFDLGKLLHHKLTESQLDLDSFLLNSLITLYSKCGDWYHALSIFQNMGNKRDLVSWSAMMSCFANNNMESEALVTFLDMLEDGFHPNEYCFTASFRSCSNAEYFSIGCVIFGFVLKTGYFDSDVCVGCSLIDMFVKGGNDIESARMVFEKMRERNVVTWTLMITRFAQMGLMDDAIDLFLSMLLSGYAPDRFTLTSLLSACAELEFLSLGKQLHSWVIRSGLASDVCVGCSLVDMYAKCAADGSVENSRKVFDRMPDHNVMSWTALISGYVQGSGQEEEAVKLFCEMVLQGHVAPNCFTFSSVLKACANLPDFGFGEQLHGQTIKLGISAINCVGNALVSVYARSGRMECARRSFDILFEKNLISRNNTGVAADGKYLNSEEAFEYEIERNGIGANSFTYACLLSGAACVGTIGKGEQIHALVVKAGFGTNLCINNALISMYSKCGNKEAALQVFNDMENRNVISWTSIISGFAKHGFATKALELFYEMLEVGVKPNEVTYIAVLSACSHVGLVDEAWKHFNSMRYDHGVVPRMEHYACMVDLLGRSGLLSEAIEFINSMPFDADALVWRTFLGSCRVHRNTELGEHAAKMILEKEPHDPATYILLSNLYASEGRWDDVAAIRKSMKQKKLIKEAGYSWIEVENQVHKFHVGDTSHPQAQKIYEELDVLALKIKNLGYVPNTDFVLHDVEEEQKEQYLFQHSEKIAVAFALISTPKPKTVRVFKNLRVCGDCHMAIKYISMVTGREIVVRDANRFHHIKDGTCSCNDYW
ncbi:pentatricopeptide repeat-containing protein At3g49170, chloroplastic [Gastrolobium bilobum]|uniref:pentatricopeptide repeat-containing protein At3g49170, chloroplastic n=1 Tax=Gastrolobium bilobum TaxID=150636 RepID=UPI002AB04CD5|nr:pentatricopeptide repeat-containing protein At3g49170, chloroplastic [Gastrolobium bilobum]